MSTLKHTILLCTLALSATVATAEEVELYSSDGNLSLRGQLIEFIDQKYTIDTAIGMITIDSASVLCRGESCPTIAPPVSDFSIVGVDMLASKLVSDLLPFYVQSLGAQLNKAGDSVDGAYSITNAKDEEIAKISLIDTALTEDLSSLLHRPAAIALTPRPLLPEEVSELDIAQIDVQSPDNSQVIGLDAITIITAKDNPISAISTSNIAKVFSGEYKNWSEVGGADAPIKLYGPETDSVLTTSFSTQVFRSQDDSVSQLAQDIVTVENIAERVSSDLNGIGYTYFSKSQPAKNLAIQGVCGQLTPANSFTIKAEEYPLTQRFYAYRMGQNDVEHIDTLLSFIQSDAGQDIVSLHGLINQRDTSTPISNQGIRFATAIAEGTTKLAGDLLREMVTQISDNKRLSTTFRFETGSNQMDQRAQADVVRLAKKLLSPDNGDKVVNLLGFTDSVGDFELNQELSLRRANQIRNALIEIDATLANQVSISPSGFGEIAPIACNETAQGRSINRRVEVWMGKGE